MKMGQAMKQAAAFVHDHPQESLAILKKRFPNVDEGVLQASYEAVRDMTPTPPVPEAQQLANAEGMNIAAGFMKAEDRLKSYDALFTAEFAR
jgi:ABC-type nitrate/sulfonate/bicarbonate transport system substrate-binding protein